MPVSSLTSYQVSLCTIWALHHLQYFLSSMRSGLFCLFFLVV